MAANRKSQGPRHGLPGVLNLHVRTRHNRIIINPRTGGQLQLAVPHGAGIESFVDSQGLTEFARTTGHRARRCRIPLGSISQCAIHALNHFTGANEHSLSRTLTVRNDIEAMVHSIDQIDIPASAGPIQRLRPPGLAIAIGMARAIDGTKISLGLDDAQYDARRIVESTNNASTEQITGQGRRVLAKRPSWIGSQPTGRKWLTRTGNS
jgi:hypothetical protein